MQVRKYSRAGDARWIASLPVKPRQRTSITKRGLLLSLLLLCAGAKVSPAEGTTGADAQTAAADLAHASDFRVRVQAALTLGRSRADGARLMLEHALTDPSPPVRSAAAAALVAVGDRLAASAVERQLRAESSGSVRSQLRATLDALRGRAPATTPTTAGATERYVVQLGSMKNMTGIRGLELSQLMRDAARAHAASLPGARVVESGDARTSSGAPVLLLDGQLTHLSQRTAAGTVRVEAQVEFMVRRVPQQTLKGTLSGSATTTDSVRVVTTGRVLEMQNQAVGGAVESAMRGADRGLTLAAR